MDELSQSLHWWSRFASIVLVSRVSWAALAGTVAQESVGYFEEIKPLFAVHCYKCHDAETHKGGFQLETRSQALKGGNSGDPAVVPSASAHSELVRRITSTDPDEQMPPKGLRLAPDEVARIKQWIDEGAKWPERDEYWAFQPPTAPPFPAGKAAHPIDRFIDAKLAAVEIKPMPPADARTLMRRAYLDLLGVPPTPEEAKAFLDECRDGSSSEIRYLRASWTVCSPTHATANAGRDTGWTSRAMARATASRTTRCAPTRGATATT